MNGFFNVSSSPHVRSGETTRSIMLDVALALIPASAFGVYHFGIHALLVLFVSVAVAIVSEYAFQKITGQKVTITDGSALVTGLLIGMNMPPEIPLWVPALGSIFAIIFVKQFFGGIGQNFMNPALGARCFLLISFTSLMSDFTVDGVSGATPLVELSSEGSTSLMNAFLGFTHGTIGEVSALALLIGGAYLLIRKVITWEIPILYVVSFAVFEVIFGGHGFSPVFVASEICSGGLLLGAIFMATDYVTSPITEKGKVLYAVLLGVLTGVFRTYGASAEGVSYAIIISNLLVPLIERVTMPTAFGYEANAMGSKDAAVSIKTYKPAISLLVITLVAGLALGAAYEMTKGPIQKAEEAAAIAAYVSVCPDAADFQESDDLEAKAEELMTSDSDISNGTYGNIVFESVYQGVDASGNAAGYVVNVTSKDGFGGDITITVGVSEDKKVTGMEFLTINETAGLGMNAQNPEFMDQFIGKEGSFNLVKDGASGDNDIQALSGATITSTAVTNAMNAALYLIGSAAE